MIGLFFTVLAKGDLLKEVCFLALDEHFSDYQCLQIDLQPSSMLTSSYDIKF